MQSWCIIKDEQGKHTLIQSNELKNYKELVTHFKADGFFEAYRYLQTYVALKEMAKCL